MRHLCIANRQRKHRINSGKLRDLISFLASKAEAVHGQRDFPRGEISVILVDDKGSAEAHSASFGLPDATDVITLRYAAEPCRADGKFREGAETAELIVNVCRAVQTGEEVAKKRRSRKSASEWSPSHELALYIAHGLDHLANVDDDLEPRGQMRMRRREMRFVGEAEKRKLIAGLIDAR